MSKFIGLDFLFTQREYCQSLQTDNTGNLVLVNSSKRGDLLAVRPVPDHVLEKPWFNRKLRRPRDYLGISRIDDRVARLSYMLHVITQHGFPSRAVMKSVYRLSLIWYNTRYKDMCKHVGSITREILRSKGASTRNPGTSNRLDRKPRFIGEKSHENGIRAPLWSYTLAEAR